MILVKTWKPIHELKWRSSIAQFIHDLESSGYPLQTQPFIRGNEIVKHQILIPGLDQVFHSILPASLEGEWTQAVQRTFWNQAELQIHESRKELQWKWPYWSPLQIFLHLAINLLFLVELLVQSHSLAHESSFYESQTSAYWHQQPGLFLMGLVLANFIPFGFNIYEGRKIQKKLTQAGFKPTN